MMIFLAGLQGIPKEQYEAASIDGAGKLKLSLCHIAGTENAIKYVIMITVIQAMKLLAAVCHDKRPSEFHQNHGVLCV